MNYDTLMSLIIKYGGARLATGLAIGDVDAGRKAKYQQESDDTFTELQQAVYRLFRERGEDDGHYSGEPGPDG